MTSEKSPYFDLYPKIYLMPSHNLLKNGNVFYLPQDCGPSINIYFFVAQSGNNAASPYLAMVTTNRTIQIYKRTDNPDYLFGSVSFFV